MNIKDIITKWRKHLAEKRAEHRIREAEDRYQLQEYNSQLWLTYCGALVCPTTMLKDDAIAAVNVMRFMYIERKKKDEGED